MATPSDDQRPGERIAKMLARAGVASRREVERMIDEGRVAIDGSPVTTPATILASLAGVTVDGRPVAAAEPARLFLYHKPVGLLVTERDPAGRPTIYDRLPKGLPRLVPVGRLDLNTEGLLLLTTDGGLKRALELPASGVERTYRARVHGPVSQPQLEALMDGIEIDGIRYGSIDANLERRTGANAWIELTLTEGKNREVRRVLEHLGLQVGRLIRTRYGPFILADMPVGTIGEVRSGDLAHFERQLAKKQKPDALVAVAPIQPPRPTPSDGGDADVARTTRPIRGSLSSSARPEPVDGGPQQRPARGSRAEHLDPAQPRTPRGPRPSTSSGRTAEEGRSRRPARNQRNTHSARPEPVEGHTQQRPQRNTPPVRPELVEGRAPRAPARNQRTTPPVRPELVEGRAQRAPARNQRNTPSARPELVEGRAQRAPARNQRNTPSVRPELVEGRAPRAPARNQRNTHPARPDTTDGRPQQRPARTSTDTASGPDTPPRPARPQRKPGWARPKPKTGPGKPRK